MAQTKVAAAAFGAMPAMATLRQAASLDAEALNHPEEIYPHSAETRAAHVAAVQIQVAGYLAAAIE